MEEEIINMLSHIEKGDRFEIITISNKRYLIDLMTFTIYKLPNGIEYDEHLYLKKQLSREETVNILVFLNTALTLLPNFGSMKLIKGNNQFFLSEERIEILIKNLNIHFNINKQNFYVIELLYKFINKKPTIHSNCKQSNCKWRYFCNFNKTKENCSDIKQYCESIIRGIIECYLCNADYTQIKQEINNLHLQVNDFLL